MKNLEYTFELFTRYQQEAPTGTISEAGVRQILTLIQSQDIKAGDWQENNPKTTHNILYTLPPDWDWVWLVTEGAYRGTFPKRVRKYYRETFQLKAPDSFIQEVGNIAKQHSETGTRYDFEFVDTFDWQAGDFGDDGSCFWGENSGARDLMAANGALAVRFYNDNDTGMARAWLAPVEVDLYMLFNGYGFSGNPTLTIARAVARFLNLQYKRIYLTNEGFDDSLLWINGGIGYVLGTAERIKGIEHYDFGWSEADYSEDYN